MDIETAHQAGKDAFGKSLAVLVGLAALIGAALGTLEVDAGKSEERALLMASRLSVEIFGKIAGSGPPRSAESQSGQAATVRAMEGTLRKAGAETLRAAGGNADVQQFQERIASVDERVGARLQKLSESIGAVPSESSGVDPVTRAVISQNEDDLRRLLARQQHQVDVAEKYGQRGTRAVFALSLVALTAVLLGLAAVVGRESGGKPILVLASGTLTLASGWGASALLV
jgi:hypothetical protein